MASLTELIDDVYVVTNRPDLVAETKLAVKKATLKSHHVDFFPKDLFETGISWATPAFIQSIQYRALIPRWRAFKYLRKYSSDVPGDFFSLLTPDESLDSYGINRENICYLAGESLEVRSSTQDEFMILGCYLHPDLTDNNFTSWIAQDHPYMIVYEAAKSVLKQIGFDEQAAMMQREVDEQIALLRQEITAGGY